MDLNTIQPTQESLWSAASYAMSSFSPETLKDTWNAAFVKASASHRLTLLYLANEICQRSRRTNEEFVTDRCFGGILPGAFGTLAKQKPEYKDKLNRIIQVWQERNTFSDSELTNIRSAMSGESNGDGFGSKRPRASPPMASPNDAFSPQSDSAENSLSFDPLLARVPSSTSLMSNDIDDQSNIEPAAGESYMMEVVRLAKSLDVPEEFAALFRRVAQAESENVKFELDQETQDRLALRVYKLAKATPEVSDTIRKEIAKLAEFPFARQLDTEERRVEEELKANKDMYEVAETIEHIVIDAKQGLDSISVRKRELELQIDRDQQNIIDLSELMDQRFGPNSKDAATSLGITTEEKEAELQELNQSIADYEEVIGAIRSKIDQERTESLQQAQQQQAMLQHLQQQQYQQPQQPQQPVRQKRQRWGDPTPVLETTAGVNPDASQPWPSPSFAPPPLASAAAWPPPPAGGLAVDPNYQYPPPPSMDYYMPPQQSQWYPPPSSQAYGHQPQQHGPPSPRQQYGRHGHHQPRQPY